MKYHWYRLIVCCIITICTLSIYAQRPASTYPSGSQRGQRQAPQDTTGGEFAQQRDKFFNDAINEDTLDAKYYNLQLPNKIHIVNDTSIHRYSHHYDWSRKRYNDYAHLGNVGSAAFPLIYQQTHREGFDIGLHQLDLWKFDESDRKFYELTKSFTHFSYSQSNQQNHLFEATFARSFADNFSIALDYRRINQVGIYQQQNIDHSNLHLGLRYHGDNNRYKMYLSILSNGLEGDESGGITTDTLFGLPDFETAATIPVTLATSSSTTQDGAQFRHQQRSYLLYQSYSLLKDSTDLTKPQLTLSNALGFDRKFYKYGDELGNLDLTFYEDLVVNPQGLRMYITENILSNHFKLFLGSTANPSKPEIKATHIEAGLKLMRHQINDEIADSTVFNILLTGGGQIDLGKSVSVYTKNHFVVAGDNAGTYKIQGDFEIDLDKYGTLKASLLNQNYQPSLIHQSAPISGNRLWNNDFSNINELSIGANYSIQSINAKVGFGYHLLNNYVIFNSDFTPVQKESEVSILQLSLEKNFVFKNIHLDNYAVYQTSSSTDIPLPSLYSKHSLYTQGKVFKGKMLLRTGFEVRFVDGYDGYDYMPLLGQFYPDSEFELAPLTQIDFFLSFKVGQMRVFAKMEHLEDYWNNGKNYFVNHHAIYDASFRFGVDWYLIN